MNRRIYFTADTSSQLGQNRQRAPLAPTEGPDDFGAANRGGTTGRRRVVAPTVYDEPTNKLLAWVAVIEGQRVGSIYPLKEGETLFGRESDCDIFTQDERSSGRHAKIRVEAEKRSLPGEEHFILYDLGSSNGTFVNDQQIYRQELVDRDKIRIGQTVYIFIRV